MGTHLFGSPCISRPASDDAQFMPPVIVNRSPTLTKTARVYASSGGRWLGQSRTLIIVCSSASHSGAADGAMFTCWGRTVVTNQHEASEFGPPWSLGGGSSRASTDMSLAHRGLWSKVSSHQSTTCKRQCRSCGEAQQVWCLADCSMVQEGGIQSQLAACRWRLNECLCIREGRTLSMNR